MGFLKSEAFSFVDPVLAAQASDDPEKLDPFDLLGRKAKKAGEKKQKTAAASSLLELQRQFDIGQERLEPFFQEAVPAFQLQSAISGARGPEAQAEAFQQFQESPGTQFLREQGLRLIDTGAGATGGLGGGERLRELTKFSQGLALQDQERQFNQLGVVSGQGQAAGQQLVGLGERFATGTGGILGQQASAAAQGIANQQAQQQSTLGTIVGGAASIFSDIRLKENIEKIGELNGLNWYQWDWTEEAKAIVGDQQPEGVIAQEVQEIFPAAVTEKDGFMTVDYSRIH